MGAYMATPSTEKNISCGHTEFFTYGVSSMQGWRVQQEDAHNCVPDFDPARHASLFAVYDGHGGPEVAEYCANHLPDFLRKLPAYLDNNPVDALKQLFLDFDASLTTPEARSVLRTLCKKSNKDSLSEDAVDSEEEESDSAINALCAEAEQPLESVLQRYGGEEALPSDVKELLDRKKQDSVGECSQGRSNRRERKSNAADSSDNLDASTSGDGSSTVKDSTADKDCTDDKAVSNGPDTTTNPDENPEDEEDSDDESVDPEAEEADDDEDSDSDDTESTDSDDDEEEDGDDVENLGFRLPVLKGQDDSEPGVDSGTTACVALFLPMDGVVKLFVANAGDSRAVLCRGAAAVDLSVDHKPDDEDEKSRITAAGGTVTRDGRVNGGLNLSRALGDHCYKQSSNLPLSEQMITPCPDVTQYDLIPGSDDFLVIACDGVWNSMTSQEVVDFVYERLHPKVASGDKPSDDAEAEAALLTKICGELFDHCLAPNTDGDGTGCDNMTCVIVHFRDLAKLAKLSPPTVVRKRAAVANGGEDDVTTVEGTTINGATKPVSPKRLKADDALPVTAAAPLANGGTVE